jgi:hypothetical protein
MLKTLLLVLSFCLYGPLLAADSDLEAAARFYQRGEFDRAIALYEKRLSNEPANASLYHNLGLSYYRNRQLGPAIAAYLQAAQLQPGEPDIRYNLEFLLKQTQDKLDARLNRNWFDGLSLSHWLSERMIYYSLCLFLWMVLGSLAVLVYRRRWLWSFGFLTAFGGLASLYLMASFLYIKLWSPNWGAISKAEVEVFSSPTSKQAIVIFALREGAPVAIIDERGEWVKIALSDDKTGWIPKEHLVAFGPHWKKRPARASPESSPTL